MKKIIYSLLVLFTAMTVITSCASKKMTAGTSVSRGKISGTWILNNINYEGIEGNAVKSVFDQGPASDFQGSTWQLTNSGKGMYSLSNGSTQPIFWSFVNDNMMPVFQFKKLSDGVKAKNTEQGYKLDVASADGATMTLKAPVQFDGRTGYIVYSFAKK